MTVYTADESVWTYKPNVIQVYASDGTQTDYVPERTCYDKNKSARERGAILFLWRCSNCDESYDTEMDRLNYCPNCGARVVGE